ncbi:MAG TPA: tRNA adenosine deaminase-associated protein [Mycobacteriales bacterium]|nr:tRNA adenosine deaminase-associated protein [Mycobacteriales bacterium]
MSYFAAALVRFGDGWTAHEVDLDEMETIDDVVDLLRELDGAIGTTLLLVEEDDEYVAIVRLDADQDDPRVFVSDGRAAETFAVAEMLVDGIAQVPLDPDSDEPVDHDGDPVGDPDLLLDLGTSPVELRALCAQERSLPSDVISAVCEKAGCLDELEALREG